MSFSVGRLSLKFSPVNMPYKNVSLWEMLILKYNTVTSHKRILKWVSFKMGLFVKYIIKMFLRDLKMF